MRLIEQVWFQNHRAKYWLMPLLFPLTCLFAFISWVRRLLFKCKVKPTVKLAKPVIVVGNIGIGGNGKTPIVLFLIELCREMGLTPGVVSRGYGGKAPSYPYLLDENSTAEESGDEALMIYQRSKALVCVGSDRIASGEKLIELGCDILIADDGLQHYRLARDIELIVIDGKRRFGNGYLLPAGPLREGQWRLKHADMLINNGGKPELNEVPMTLVPQSVTNLKTGNVIPLDFFIQTNRRINAIAGIGDPYRFFKTLKRAGFSVAIEQGFVDHHQFTEQDFAHFDELPLLMTEKDAVKCKSFAKDNYWYLPVEAQLPELCKALIKERILTFVK